MLYIGSHVGYGKDKGLVGSVEEAISYGSNTFMFYTGAPQNTFRSSIDLELVSIAKSMMDDAGIDFSKVVVHAPYIVNLANEDVDKHEFAINFLKQEVKRCDTFGVNYMVLHPGAHVGIGIDAGIDNIVDGLNKIIDDSTKVKILLETMAGKGSEVGSKLEEIKSIIDGVNNKKHIGVCLDTCHLNDAGYDMSDFDSFLDEFDKIVGLDYIQCIHINDSKNIRGSHKDRHENIGFGTIGFDNLINIIYNTRLGSIPRILETPYINKEFAPYKYEIEMIRSKKFDNDMINKITK